MEELWSLDDGMCVEDGLVEFSRI